MKKFLMLTIINLLIFESLSSSSIKIPGSGCAKDTDCLYLYDTAIAPKSL